MDKVAPHAHFLEHLRSTGAVRETRATRMSIRVTGTPARSRAALHTRTPVAAEHACIARQRRKQQRSTGAAGAAGCGFRVNECRCYPLTEFRMLSSCVSADMVSGLCTLRWLGALPSQGRASPTHAQTARARRRPAGAQARPRPKMPPPSCRAGSPGRCIPPLPRPTPRAPKGPRSARQRSRLSLQQYVHEKWRGRHRHE
jgi:hypothetical protein